MKISTETHWFEPKAFTIGYVRCLVGRVFGKGRRIRCNTAIPLATTGERQITHFGREAQEFH